MAGDLSAVAMVTGDKGGSQEQAKLHEGEGEVIRLHRGYGMTSRVAVYEAAGTAEEWLAKVKG